MQESILITLYNYDSNTIKYYILNSIPVNQQKIIDDKGKILINREVVKRIELSKSQFETQLMKFQSVNSYNKLLIGIVMKSYIYAYKKT